MTNVDIPALKRDFAAAFRVSGYPHSQLTFHGHGVQVLVRVPPRLPEPPVTAPVDWAPLLSACPSIESIQVDIECQGHGIFHAIVATLGEQPGVDFVCISNVKNQSFSDYLTESPEWTEIEMPILGITQRHSLRSFYKRVG